MTSKQWAGLERLCRKISGEPTYRGAQKPRMLTRPINPCEADRRIKVAGDNI